MLASSIAFKIINKFPGIVMAQTVDRVSTQNENWLPAFGSDIYELESVLEYMVILCSLFAEESRLDSELLRCLLGFY